MRILRRVLLVALIGLGATSQLVGQPTLHRIRGGLFEASGVVHVPGSDGVLFVDDGQTSNIRWMELSGDGSQKGPSIAIPLPGVKVVDLEGMTTDGVHFYAVGSQSKSVGFDGDGLVRFEFDPAARKVGKIESVRDLKRFLSRNVAELRGAEHRIGDEALNIEGLAWDPTQSRLLLGLRAPVSGADALVVPLSLRDPAGPFTAENLAIDGKRVIRIPAAGAGLRSIEYDSARSSFVIITGAALNAENTDFRVLEWSGQEGTFPVEIRRYSRKLKPEGITRATVAGRDARVIVFDTGNYEVIQ
jgi:hypothetical protein